nr:UDP-N-acetylmuramoyl-L-alanine--D-glutamate ligase [Oleiagrimonas sp. C23AA]
MWVANKRAPLAVWGFGREGRAALHFLLARRGVDAAPLTLFCRADEAAAAREMAPPERLLIETETPDAGTLAGFDIVLKSPGISAYTPALLEARARGTQVSSGTALWFAQRPDARVIAVTGTKGKSTTSALIAHLARALGVRTALAGNIGLPLLELVQAQADLWVIELSSFQTREAGALELGVITSLYTEHLDWHGSAENYMADKLALADVSQALLVNGTQPDLLERTASHPGRQLFGGQGRWHLADGFICRDADRLFAIAELPLPGAHNALNACAALAALEHMGLDARTAVPALARFQALPHRQQSLGERDGRTWINDSISTTPQATLAALRSFAEDAKVTVIVGGHDRGLDWSEFARAMAEHAPHAILCQGANGQRIARALRAAGVACGEVADLAAAVDAARQHTPAGGTVLMSPGAPSFDQFRDYTARGLRFAELAGFDTAPIRAIDGLGVSG